LGSDIEFKNLCGKGFSIEEFKVYLDHFIF
jgi:hypothetical protein